MGEMQELQNRVLRRIFRSKMDENEEWRKLHNDELHSLYIYIIKINSIFKTCCTFLKTHSLRSGMTSCPVFTIADYINSSRDGFCNSSGRSTHKTKTVNLSQNISIH